MELLSNSDFTLNVSNTLPNGWTIRNPVVPSAVCHFEFSPKGISISSPKNPYAFSALCQQIENINGGCAYLIKSSAKISNIRFPYRSLFVVVTWRNNNQVIKNAGENVKGPFVDGDSVRFEDVLIAPKDANNAIISLEARWIDDGTVTWQNASMTQTEFPSPRKVKIGTVYLRPSTGSQEKNLELWCEQIDNAGKLGLDIVCLCEAITMVGTNFNVFECARPIPGEHTEIIGKSAKKNNIWVVAGLMELFGERVYNTAVLFNRNGDIAGTYHKVHLPGEEWKWGVTPGTEYPTFKTDFGTIAMQICYDWFFPETAEIFAMNGAEIIFAPTWGNTLPDHDGIADGETVFRVRARDNCVYMVPSVYDGNSMIIDPVGRILASSKGKTGVFWAEVDLNNREALDWVGYWRSIVYRHRMPETYSALLTYPL
ncbi:MAG: carbon-nitrogen hydrolase family protein [Candidatus Poribacteria bacterium]